MRAEQVVPGDGAVRWRGRRGRVVGRRRAGGDDDGRPDAGEAGSDLGQPRPAVDGGAVVVVAGRGDEDDGLDLAEAVEDAERAEVGRAGREDRPERGRGQHGDHGLGPVGQPRRHPVAGPDAELLERRGQGSHVPHELAAAALLAVAGLVVADDGRLVARPPGEEVLGHVEVGVGEEPGGRHVVVGDDHLDAAAADDAALVPDRGPELRRLFDRPAVQLRVPGLADVVQEAGQVGGLGPGRVGPPEGRAAHAVHDVHRRTLNGAGWGAPSRWPRRSRCGAGRPRRTSPAGSRRRRPPGTCASCRRRG